ncbi:VapE domain-containing protein, partial [Faecalibacterium sp. AF27-11BH]|uniref:VapE domain-containing protein n=1 Tax=Faecalibacterium sp. AF27-11BH TaxID=2302956 RepID=UPI001FA9DB2E
MTLDYFYGQSGELFAYFRIPKALFQDSRFRQLSTDARTLYGILLDRMSLSVKNNWLDEQGRVYIIYTVREVQESLCCAEHKAVKLFRELEQTDLIERKRRGLGRPSLIYVKNFSSGLPKAQVRNENKYHPIRDYLSALVWDGTERIRFCLRHFLGADADDYTYEALKLFLLGAISRAFQPGCKFEIMLCLVGGQGAGKSTFFRLLAVRDEWFSDDLRKLDDDNVYRKLQGHWIIEMSEMMATANAKSIEEIKSFLSRQKEVYKIPYETHPADRPRQCVFGGTSNALD